jgi:2-keto-4-pentenoate hydratase/2-oxohepta-3-ene-1,7-dioic acid hydratase in catechol pathway
MSFVGEIKRRTIVQVAAVCLMATLAHAQVSDAPDAAFKLAAFESAGLERVGMLLNGQLLDIERANAELQTDPDVSVLNLSRDMKTLIERSDVTMPRLFQIANHFSGRVSDLEFALDVDSVSLKAPIRYPWNLLAAGGNYRAHAAEMGTAAAVDPDKENPFLFAKSPRSTIIDPGQPYVIPPGRDRIDWEGEFAIVIGKQAKNVTLDTAMDHVFGFTIIYDVSDRAAQIPDGGRYARDWFSGKSMDNAAPMGPFIVPKEFVPNYGNLRITTKVNGEIMQDSNTSYLIHGVEHLVRYVSSRMTLWPGDVIATGTPSGVGAGRKPPVFLKRGDTVAIDIEDIGTLVTPIE